MCAQSGGKQAANSLAVTVLPDGRVKLETGSFKGAAHTSAEKFLQVLLQELGVDVEQRSALGHVHHHHHNNQRAAAGGGSQTNQ